MKALRLLVASMAVLAVVSTARVGTATALAGATSSTTQYGMDTYFTYDCQSPATVEQWAQTEISQFKALGANSIGLGFPLYTNSLTSNDVFAKTNCSGHRFQSPSPSILGDVITIAHSDGMTVLLRPLIDEESLWARNPLTSRAELRPSNVTLWFKNYATTLDPYLRVAQQDRVESFAIETELDSLADLNNWPSVIAGFRKLYSGDLVWNYSWRTEVRKLHRKSTTLGVDTYPILKGAGLQATPAQLLAGWDTLLSNTRYYGIGGISDATIDEIGIAAQDGAYASSSAGVLLPPADHPFNQQVQANWFTAACDFMKQHKMRGIYFWGSWLAVNAGSLPTAPVPTKPSEIQPAGQSAIATCFSGG